MIARPTRAALPGLLMFTGGAAILATLAIDYMAHFWAYVISQGVGFALILASSMLLRDSFSRSLPWALVVVASAVWLNCWSWFLTLGLLIPIPLAVWAVIGTVAYAWSTFLQGKALNRALSAVSGVLALGSLLSTSILIANPVFASDLSYIPFAAGAVVGGVVCVIIAARAAGRSRTVD